MAKIILLFLCLVFVPKSPEAANAANIDTLLTHLVSSVTNLTATVATLECKLRTQQEKHAADISKLQKTHSNDIKALEGVISEKQSNIPMIAFHVALTHTQSSQGKIAFNKIISNPGNGWSSVTHTFRAPTKGVYYFCLTIGKQGSGRATSNLMHGSTHVGIATTSEAGWFESGTTSTVLVLEAGDHVYANHHLGVIYSDVALYTHLVGFLMQQTD